MIYFIYKQMKYRISKTKSSHLKKTIKHLLDLYAINHILENSFNIIENGF